MNIPDFQARCDELVARGEVLSKLVPQRGDRVPYWFSTDQVTGIQAWIGSVANLIRMTVPSESYFNIEYRRLSENVELLKGIPIHSVIKLLGLLKALQEEMRIGFLTKVEYIFVASTFDDFIDHAEAYHKSDKKIEAAVLASAVFEDAIRRLADKFGVTHGGSSLDSVIDELAKRDHINQIKAKRYKSYASLRNSALHARWDEFDIKDVGQAINGMRSLIEELLEF